MQTSTWWTRLYTATWYRLVAWNDRIRQRDWERLDAAYKRQIQEAWHKAHDQQA